MAIYIQLNRTEHDDSSAIYEFGPVERIVGHVIVAKPTGDVELLDITDDQTARTDFFLSRIRRVFRMHAENGEFPVKTDYRA